MIRMHSMLLLASVTCTAAAAQPCHAAFQWLRMVLYECNPPGLEDHEVWRIYAEFSHPDDRLSKVFAQSSAPVSIGSNNGLYQNPAGGNTAPDAEVVAKFPLVAWDTFCTIGLARDIDSSDQTLTSPGFPALPVMNNTSMFWLVPNIEIEQGAPDASGRVLIMQLTVPDGSFLDANVNLTYRPAGSSGFINVFNQSPILLPLHAGDLNDDLIVDVDDLIMVVNSWGQTGAGIADPTDDNKVDVDDLLLIINQWGNSLELCGG